MWHTLDVLRSFPMESGDVSMDLLLGVEQRLKWYADSLASQVLSRLWIIHRLEKGPDQFWCLTYAAKEMRRLCDNVSTEAGLKVMSMRTEKWGWYAKAMSFILMSAVSIWIKFKESREDFKLALRHFCKGFFSDKNAQFKKVKQTSWIKSPTCTKILSVSFVVDNNILRSFYTTELMHGRLVLVIGFEWSNQGKYLA